jgi:isocitrate/isopropylmalate dehydrogenase
MSGVMMLNHLADTEGREDFRACAVKIKNAYDSALQEGDRTRDLGGRLGTMEFADELIKRM